MGISPTKLNWLISRISSNHQQYQFINGIYWNHSFLIGNVHLPKVHFAVAMLVGFINFISWWFRNPANQLRLVVEIPLFKGLSTIPGGGSPDFWTINSILKPGGRNISTSQPRLLAISVAPFKVVPLVTWANATAWLLLALPYGLRPFFCCWGEGKISDLGCFFCKWW